jgi:hypothetical protein
MIIFLNYAIIALAILVVDTSSHRAQAAESPSSLLLAQAQMTEHAVIVHFAYGSTDLTRLFELEDKIEAAIKRSNVGEYDGHEIATDGSDGILYMYGPSADRLFEIVEPILKQTDFMQGAVVTKRYGPPKEGVRETISRIMYPGN